MKRPGRRCSSVITALALVAGLAACSQADPGSGDAAASGSPARLTVFAASSLTAPFTELGKRFEAEHDGVKVAFSFGGSSDLAAQIQQGAPADVFASADQANMGKLTADQLVGEPRAFATNTLEIAVPPDNPAGVHDLQDLNKPGVNLVVCAPEVPCGAATQQVAHNAGMTLHPVSEEQSVTDVLSTVETGEADAGLVYVTDVEAAGDKVRGVDFPGAENVVNVYPIAAVVDSKNAALADDFVSLVVSRQGQAVLEDFGFGT